MASLRRGPPCVAQLAPPTNGHERPISKSTSSSIKPANCIQPSTIASCRRAIVVLSTRSLYRCAPPLGKRTRSLRCWSRFQQFERRIFAKPRFRNHRFRKHYFRNLRLSRSRPISCRSRVPQPSRHRTHLRHSCGGSTIRSSLRSPPNPAVSSLALHQSPPANCAAAVTAVYRASARVLHDTGTNLYRCEYAAPGPYITASLAFGFVAADWHSFTVSAALFNTTSGAWRSLDAAHH